MLAKKNEREKRVTVERGKREVKRLKRDLGLRKSEREF